MADTAKAAILEYLEALPEKNNPAVKVVGHSTPAKVKPDSILFHKSKAISGHEVCAVEFEDAAGHKFDLTGFLAESNGEWVLTVSFLKRVGGRKIVTQTPLQAQLFSNTEGGYFGCGYVTGQSSEVAQVWLVFKDFVLQDLVEEKIVLFATDRVLGQPLRLEFYDAAAKLLATQNFPVSLSAW